MKEQKSLERRPVDYRGAFWECLIAVTRVTDMRMNQAWLDLADSYRVLASVDDVLKGPMIGARRRRRN